MFKLNAGAFLVVDDEFETEVEFEIEPIESAGGGAGEEELG